jgi:hypothetical protein
MAKPQPRPEADMLQMQHAHIVAQLVRQNDAAREKARRDAVAKARRAAAPARQVPERASAPARTAPVRPRIA